MMIEIMPSLRCNLKCEGCDRGVGFGPLNAPDLEDFSLVSTLLEKTGEATSVTISGGEPTLYGRLEELLDFLPSSLPVEIKTNGVRLLDLPTRLLLRCTWTVSVYKESKFLDFRPLNKLTRAGIISVLPIQSFDDLDEVGTERTGYDPMRCFMPTLVGNLSRVYPCCRAFRYSESSGNQYFLPLEDFTVEGLAKIITDTDMCRKCPRYMIGGRISK